MSAPLPTLTHDRQSALILTRAQKRSNTANPVVTINANDANDAGNPASVDPAARRFVFCFVLRLMPLGRRAVVHPDHHHKLVLTPDGIGLRFYGLKLGTDCLQRQGIV